jgi:drug/metabolite transporter (DMT)-like permease
MQQNRPVEDSAALPRAAEDSFGSALRGISAMVACQFAFVLNDTLNKLASESLPMGQIIFIRGLCATFLVGIIVVTLGLHRQLPLLWNRLVAVRVIGELGGTYFFLLPLFHMPIGNVMIIFQAVPLTVTAGAALFFREAVGWRRWAAVTVGFIGVLIVIRPGLSGFDGYGLLVLISVLFVAFRDLATRAMPLAIPTLCLTLATAASVTVMGGLMGLTEEWVLPSSPVLAQVAGASVFLTIGYGTSIMAMRNGDMSVTASFRYVGVVFAIASGFLVWSDVPDWPTIAGSLVIVGAGLYTLYREHKLARLGRPLIAAPASIDSATGA